jgi:ABC-type branched-subunit amino acid transport system permease subunit
VIAAIERSPILAFDYAFSMVAYSLVINGAVFRLFGGLGWGLYLLGGGSMYVPPLTILGMQFGPHEFVAAFYNMIVAAFIATGLVLWRISASPFGQALRGIRDNETRAAFIGIPVWRYRWYAFIFSGLFVGVAGALYEQLARQITPDQLHWLFSAQLIALRRLRASSIHPRPQFLLDSAPGVFAFLKRDLRRGLAQGESLIA